MKIAPAYFWIPFLIALTASSCSVKPDKQSNASQSGLTDEQEAENSELNAGDIDEGFKDAYLELVYPVLINHCASCHNTGAQHFASEDLDLAVQTAQRLIGTSLENSRFYLKPVEEQHPSQEISSKAIPLIEAALIAFFDRVSHTMNVEGYLTENVNTKDSTSHLLETSNMGVLIVETEGFSVQDNTGMIVSHGAYSNNYALNSRVIPSHPISGGGRVRGGYGANDCDPNRQAQVFQAAHTQDPEKATNGDVGEIKYVLQVDVAMLEPVLDNNGNPILDDNGNPTYARAKQGNNDITAQGLFFMLPNNSRLNQDYIDKQGSADYDYLFTGTTYAPPAKNQMTWHPEQIDAAIAFFEERNKNIGNQSDSFKAAYAAMKAAIDPNNDGIIEEIDKVKVFDFLDIAYNPTTGQINNVRFGKWDYGTSSMTYPIDFGNNLHQNEVVPRSTFSGREEYITRGFAELEFKVPNTLTLQSEITDTVRFELWTLVRGRFAIGFESTNDNSMNFCNGVNTGNAQDARWERVGRDYNLKPGESYKITFFEDNETSFIDKIMLVADPDDIFDGPSRDPTSLRHPVYGVEGEGKQKAIQKLSWNLDIGGKLEMEIVTYDKFYGLQAPKIILDSQNVGKNINLTGFNFLINGNVALTDRNFTVNDVRPANAILEYGQVMIPTDKGIEVDQLAINFANIQLSDEFASLPRYEVTPEIGKVQCYNQDFFQQWIWPLYRQQVVVVRDDYNDVAQKFASSGSQLEQDPTFYKCTDCHGDDHPFFPIPDSVENGCVESIKRANFERPEASVSIRGALGLWNHDPLYMVFDPFDGNGNLRRHQLEVGGPSTIYGPMLGIFEAYDITNFQADFDNVKNGLSDNQKAGFLDALRYPKKLGFNENPNTGDPSGSGFDIFTSSGIFNDNNLTRSFKKSSGVADIDAQHQTIIDRYLAKFVEWVNMEKASREAAGQ